MKRLRLSLFCPTLPALLMAACAVPSPAAAPGVSSWVREETGGKLVYKTTPRGDRIMDFSSAGYGGGGVPLPATAEISDRETVKPSGSGDDTSAIQAALDRVAARLPDAHGFRGAVRLAPGAFTCGSTLNVAADGVVLRGSGSSGAGETVIRMAGGPPHLCFRLGKQGARGQRAEGGKGVRVIDTYVPSGTMSLHVADASVFHPGDRVTIHRPVTPEWVAFMGMDTLVRNGKKQTWISGETTSTRTIAGIGSSNELVFDIPLTDSLDSQYLGPNGATITAAAPDRTIAQCGIESLHIVSPPQAIGIGEAQNQAVRVNGVRDGWLRDLAIDDTINSVDVGGDCRRVTVERVAIHHKVATVGAAKPADFATTGSQVLFDRCTDTGDNVFYFGTGARASGPIVLLHCVFHGKGWIQPHQRWSTGLLIDSCEVPEGGLDLMDRGIMGSGHGWTIGWSVAWNCTAKSLLIQQPPGAMNWAIGCRGERTSDSEPGRDKKGPKLPDGIYDAYGSPVAPASLYEAQLRERLVLR